MAGLDNDGRIVRVMYKSLCNTVVEIIADWKRNCVRLIHVTYVSAICNQVIKYSVSHANKQVSRYFT